MSQEKPAVKVTNSGAFRVEPADIFKSDVTKAIIKKTHQAVQTRKQPLQKPDKNSR